MERRKQLYPWQSNSGTLSQFGLTGKEENLYTCQGSNQGKSGITLILFYTTDKML
jgi:hypothetical protein